MENSCSIHDNHLLMIEVKYALCLMYGNIAGFRYEGRYMDMKFFSMLHKLCCEGPCETFDIRPKKQVLWNPSHDVLTWLPHVASEQYSFDFLYKLKSISEIDLSDDLLRRKIDLCESVLAIYEKVDPGRTSHRMNVIFELNCAKVIECQDKYRKNLIKRSDAVVRQSLIISHSQKKKLFHLTNLAGHNRSMLRGD